MGWEIVIKFLILLTKTFSTLVVFTGINKDGKGAVIQISKCFGPFTMLLFEGSCETWLFRNLSNHVFRNASAQKRISYEGRLFLKMFKIESKFPKCWKNMRKNFCFWYNCFWICCYKLCLLRREYLTLTVNSLILKTDQLWGSYFF